uniref:NF-kappa-B inhibitor-like protein 2 n=1 Tax=Iconisemion striatum TaxID=60296 RepID=A0A1A7XW82_9TELE
MSSSREIKQLQKAKSKAQTSNNLKEEANICNQLGELLSRTDLRQHDKAVEHYRKELALRQGSSTEECSTWLNIAAAQEESNCMSEDIENTLRHWQKTYSRELDKETRQECLITEKLLRKALSQGVSSAPAAAKPFDALQDSQLFDAENSEPLLTTRGGCSSSQDCKSALVPEDEYLADDWLEDDLLEMQPKKKRRLRMEGVPQSEADSCTVSWLCDQAARRYYQKCGLLPRLSLQKEGALLSPQDLLLAVLQTNEEVLAEVCSWDLPPLPERYKKACESLAVEENKRVTRLCEVQDSSSSVSVCGLCLGPPSLKPLLRALKLQASLTELRVSGNRLSDDLLPELVAVTTTMPRLRLLDVSANLITGDGLERAVGALKGQSHPAFPCLEELDLSSNPLGDAVSESLSCLLSLCPLLSKLSLQACGLTARFLQQHRLLLASALTELGHLKSVSVSHNALGSTGFELVLRTLPLHSLTHLDLSAIRSGPTDHLALEHLTKVLSQEECSLTHLSLASNGLTDSSITILSRCLPLCPTLVSLNLSGNPSVTSVGLQSILMSTKEASRPLTHLNLQGCQVSGPWDSDALDGLSNWVQDLRLCSHSLNKLDRDALKQNWDKNHPNGCFLNQSAKFLLSAADSS